jgi:hypothetical protein
MFKLEIDEDDPDYKHKVNAQWKKPSISEIQSKVNLLNAKARDRQVDDELDELEDFADNKAVKATHDFRAAD